MSKKRKHEKANELSSPVGSVLKDGKQGAIAKSTERRGDIASVEGRNTKRQKLSPPMMLTDPKSRLGVMKESENLLEDKKRKRGSSEGFQRKSEKLKIASSNTIHGGPLKDVKTSVKIAEGGKEFQQKKKKKKLQKKLSQTSQVADAAAKEQIGDKPHQRFVNGKGEKMSKEATTTPGTKNVTKSADVSKEQTKPHGSVAAGSNWQKLQQTLKSDGPPRRRKAPSSKVQMEDKISGAVQKDESVKVNSSTEERTETEKVRKAPQPLNKDTSLTKVVALDCEMVGAGRNNRSVLAHVCLVNAHGNVIYEKHVRPLEKVTDLRTHVSGIRSKDIHGPSAEDFWDVQKEVATILNGRILVGHALKNDLKALMLSHPRRDVRDTQRYKPLKQGVGKVPALRVLAKKVLDLTIQDGRHSPAEDARASLYLYLHCRKEWERSLLHVNTPTEKTKT